MKDEVKINGMTWQSFSTEVGDRLKNYFLITPSKSQVNDWIIEKDLYVNKFPSYMTDLNECSIIIATTDPSLGLPLLPAIEKLPSFIEVMGFDDNLHADNEDYAQYRMYIEGYKAASAKKYTEEDLKAAVALGIGLKSILSDVSNIEAEFKKLLEKLNPKPIQVEVEIENYRKNSDGEPIGFPQMNEITVENGYVKVKRWIYE